MHKEQQRLCNEISEMKTIVDQVQLNVRESKAENSRIELQKIRLQNLVKNFQDENLDYYKVNKRSKVSLSIFLQIVGN